MKNFKNWYLMFAWEATNGNENFSDLGFENGEEKILIRNVPAPKDWDGKEDWADRDSYINTIFSLRTGSGKYEIYDTEAGDWVNAE